MYGGEGGVMSLPPENIVHPDFPFPFGTSAPPIEGPSSNTVQVKVVDDDFEEQTFALL